MGLKIINSEYIDLLKTQIAEKDTEIRRLRAELASAKMVPQPKITEEVVAQFHDNLEGALSTGQLDWQGELNSLIQEEQEKADGL